MQRTVEEPGSVESFSWIGKASAWIERNEYLCLGGLLLFFLCQCLYANGYKQLWYDELYTMNLAMQTSWQSMRQGLPMDGNPPLLALLSRGLVKVLGVREISIRLPSLVGYIVAVLFTYLIARRRTSAIVALTACLLLCTSPFRFYAIEGRPYGLVLMFTALGIWSWQRATDDERPMRWTMWLLPVAVSGTIFSHHMGIVNLGVPLLVGEVTRTIRRKEIDVPLCVFGVVGLLALSVTLPMARATREQLLSLIPAPIGSQMPFRNLIRDYRGFVALMTLPLLLLVVTGVIALYQRRRKLRWNLTWPVHEVAAFAGSIASLLVVWLLLRFSTGYYAGLRYGLATMIGLSLMIAVVMSQYPREVCFAVLLLASPGLSFSRESLDSGMRGPLHRLGQMHGEAIVVANAVNYPQMWWYADPQLRTSLYFLGDMEYARTQPYSNLEICLIKQRDLLRMNIVDLEPFLRAHERFVVVTMHNPSQEYLLPHLKEAGIHLTPLPPDPEDGVMQVFEATKADEDTRVSNATIVP